jgi:hypothetical protein
MSAVAADRAPAPAPPVEYIVQFLDAEFIDQFEMR